MLAISGNYVYKQWTLGARCTHRGFKCKMKPYKQVTLCNTTRLIGPTSSLSMYFNHCVSKPLQTVIGSVTSIVSVFQAFYSAQTFTLSSLKVLQYVTVQILLWYIVYTYFPWSCSSYLSSSSSVNTVCTVGSWQPVVSTSSAAPRMNLTRSHGSHGVVGSKGVKL